MNLYVCHDDPTLYAHPEERVTLAIWADRPADAIDLYLRLALGNASDCPEDVSCSLEATPSPDLSPSEDDRIIPHVEKRSAVLRAIGFSCDGDRQCESCGLYEYDGLILVCEECGDCEECGHSDDCPEVDGPIEEETTV